MSIAVYIRVSTHSQKSDSQKAEISRWLKAHGHNLSEVMWYEDPETGTTMNRREFNLLTEAVFAGTVKTIVVWKLDRLSRSLKDLLVIMERIDNAGAGFKSLTESIDTTNAAGRMMMQMVGAFAEFEREMIRERTKAGLDAARAEGRVGGRRPVLRDDQKKDIIENILSDRKTGAQMARLYNVSEATISRVVAKHRQPII